MQRLARAVSWEQPIMFDAMEAAALHSQIEQLTDDLVHARQEHDAFLAEDLRRAREHCGLTLKAMLRKEDA
jgi:hypothetical protein